MTFDGAAELASAQQAYLDNRDYRSGGGSLSKAEAFRDACTALLMLIPEMSTNSARFSLRMGINLQNLATQEARATQWIALNGGSTAIQGVSFENFRD